MPLPLILGIGAAIAGAAGVGNTAKILKEANDTTEVADLRCQENQEGFTKQSEATKLKNKEE